MPQSNTEKEVAALQSRVQQLQGEVRDAEKYRRAIRHMNTIVLEFAEGHVSVPTPAKDFIFYDKLKAATPSDLIFDETVCKQEDRGMMREAIGRLARGETRDVSVTVRLLKKNGSYAWCNVAIGIDTAENEAPHCICTITDVDDAYRAEQAVQHLEVRDELTGYANYASFCRRAKELLQQRGSKKYALWYSDLVKFREINSLYGFAFGDELLRYWADCIAAEIGEDECFAHVSGDIFVVLRRYESREGDHRRYENMQHLLNSYEPLMVRRRQVTLTTGGYLVDNDESTALTISEMVNFARSARYVAKVDPGQPMAYYTREMQRRDEYEQELLRDSRRALAQGDFEVYLQPVVDIRDTMQVYGAEVKVRWVDEERGEIDPMDFYPILEHDGSIADLDLHVFQELCRYAGQRRKQGLPLFNLAMNISHITLLQPRFVEKFIAIKDEFHLPANTIQLAISEWALLDNMKSISTRLDRLRAAGFLICIDDFGSGTSGLNMLKELNADVLKLSPTFLRGDLSESRDRIIVSSIIAMANTLQLQTVAKGVESMQMVQLLHVGKCAMVQGRLFGAPVPLAEFNPQPDFSALLEDAQLNGEVPAAGMLPDAKTETMLQPANVPVGILQCEQDNYFSVLYGNRAFYRTVGITAQTMREKYHNRFTALLAKDQMHALQEMEAALNDGEEARGNLVLQLGDEKTMSLHCTMRINENDVVEICAMDNTQQWEQQKKLEQREESMRQMLDSLPIGVAMYEEIGDTLMATYVNRQLPKMLGFISQQDYLRSRQDFYNTLNRQDEETLRRCVAEVHESKRVVRASIQAAMQNEHRVLLVFTLQETALRGQDKKGLLAIIYEVTPVELQ